MAERRYDVDWLRIGAMLAVFLFHCTGFFTPIDWHLKNAERAEALLPVVAWMDLWMMPLFFLLSGFGSWYSLRSRSWLQYLWERVLRLLVPLYTVGAFLLLPPQFYIERVSHGRYSGSIWKLVPPYWDGRSSFRFRFDEPYLTNLWPGHLWFLQFLFNVSVVALPLLLLLRTGPGQRLRERLFRWSARRGGIYLFVIPLILTRIALRGAFRGEHSWADLAFYGVVFVIGALFAGDPRYLESCKRHTWLALALGLLAFAGEVVFILRFRYPYPGAESFSWRYVLFQIVMGVATWSWIVFLVGLAGRTLNANNRARAYASEAVLPFYLLHQTVILLAGWVLIPLQWPIAAKYAAIAASSLILILALYEGLIRRFNPLRFLFGMRLKGRGIFVRERQNRDSRQGHKEAKAL
jgi:peptidoglycan/LPS O-acetylase OafA/YrhL